MYAGRRLTMAGSVDQMRKGTTSLMVLKLLMDAAAPLHGYEVIQRLKASSHGAIDFKEGLIYPTLHALEQKGLIEGNWAGDAGTRRRRLYSLTEKGRRQLDQDLERWQVLSRQVNLLLGLEVGQP